VVRLWCSLQENSLHNTWQSARERLSSNQGCADFGKCKHFGKQGLNHSMIMRQNHHNRRRGRSGNSSQPRRQTPHRNQVYDSNASGVRVRGNASQICEKYLSLARDELSSGDPVKAEHYFQHAEHYQRLLAGFQQEQAEKQAVAQNSEQGANAGKENGHAQLEQDGRGSPSDKENHNGRQRRQTRRSDRGNSADGQNGKAFEEVDNREDESVTVFQQASASPRSAQKKDREQDSAENGMSILSSLPPAVQISSSDDRDSAETRDVEVKPARRGRPRKVMNGSSE